MPTAANQKQAHAYFNEIVATYFFIDWLIHNLYASRFSFFRDTQYPDRQNNVDIAASIKALAQSVHGEAIFGDLPKPRFKTEI